MNWDAVAFDWNQIRAFLATAEEGSLSAAARALRLTQPTISRQVAGLEDALGVVLFERGPRTMLLTDVGQDVLAHVRAMGEAAARVSFTAAGQSQAVGGTVSVTATNAFATMYFPDILMSLRERAPGIRLSVLTSNEIRDLTQRQADISIRHARPEQPDLIGRLVGETTAHVYASKAFLDRNGRPETIEALSEYPFIGFETVDRMLPFLRSLGMSSGEDQIVAVTTSDTLLTALVRAGLGISFLTRDMAERYEELELVFPELPVVEVPVWLVTHRELHTSRRIRLVYDCLAEALSRISAATGND